MKHTPSLLGEVWPLSGTSWVVSNLSGVQGMLARKGCALDGCVSLNPPVPLQLAAQCPFPPNFSSPGPLHQRTS